MKVLTISIAAYNIEPYLEATLNRFSQVEYLSEIEVLVVNDGSKDQTRDIALKYQKLYPESIKLIDKQNGGWGSTVNVGIQNATGKYFKLLDGDDYYNLENLGHFISFLRNCDTDMVITPYLMFIDSTGKIIPGKKIRPEFEMKEVFGWDCVSNLFAMHEIAYKTRILKENPLNISEHCFYTDIEYVMKGMKFVNTISAFPEVIYMYRIAREGQSDSFAGRIKHYKDHLHVVMTIAEERILDDGTKKRLYDDRLHGIIKRQCNFFLSLPKSKEHKTELIEYDQWVHDHCPDLYKETSRTMKVLRKTNFIMYPIIADAVRIHESR